MKKFLIIILALSLLYLVRKKRLVDDGKTQTLQYIRDENEELTWKKKLKWWTVEYWARWR